MQIGPFLAIKFEIKYDSKVFEIRNNFPYKNFLRFRMTCEQNFRETFMSWKQGKIDWNFLGTRIFETWPITSFLHLIGRKDKFPAKADQKFEFLLNVEFGLIS
jgi:hypothetical protein